ncbi:MAG: hypothetical protein M5U34_37270 [Chloroflexi bacterium]|nr:hypothetical protein [Chloroflexota bacterium]
MRQIILILLLITLALGGCAVTVRSLQPAIEQTAHAWVQAETRTDPVDDLVRFRQSERSGRAGSILLPVFALLSLALLLLLLAAPCPAFSKNCACCAKRATKPGDTGHHPHPGWGSHGWNSQTEGSFRRRCPLTCLPKPNRCCPHPTLAAG